MVINQYGEEINFNTAVQYMDDEIREQLSAIMAPCPEQAFFEAYCKAHEEAFGEEFFLNEENPTY